MSEEEVKYFRRRAEVETERAQAASVPAAVAAHYQLAEAYFEKLATASSATAPAT